MLSLQFTHAALLPAGIGVAEGPRGPCPPQIFRTCSLLRDERRYYKQNSVIRLETKILDPTKFLLWLRYCLQGQVAKLASGLFYSWSLSCNNNMATNLQMFASSYDIRRFVACES